jgi:hypothetical protein
MPQRASQQRPPAQHPEHRRAPDLVPRRQLSELGLDEAEIILDRVEVAAGLIDLA